MGNSFLSDIIKSEQNSTPTDKHFNRLAFCFAALSLTGIVAFLGYTIASLTKQNVITTLIEQIWFVLFFVEIVFTYIALHFSIKQIIRQRFASSIATISMSIIAISLFIATLVLGLILYNKLYIPFIFFPF